jgi:hypothetical protein
MPGVTTKAKAVRGTPSRTIFRTFGIRLRPRLELPIRPRHTPKPKPSSRSFGFGNHPGVAPDSWVETSVVGEGRGDAELRSGWSGRP